MEGGGGRSTLRPLSPLPAPALLSAPPRSARVSRAAAALAEPSSNPGSAVAARAPQPPRPSRVAHMEDYHKPDQQTLQALKDTANRLRISSIKATTAAGSG